MIPKSVMLSCPLARASEQVLDRFRTSSLVSATGWRLFRLKKNLSRTR